MTQKTHIQQAAAIFERLDKADLMKFIRQGIMFDGDGVDRIRRFNIALFTARLNTMVNEEHRLLKNIEIMFEDSLEENCTIVNLIHRAGTKNCWDAPKIASLSRVHLAFMEIFMIGYPKTPEITVASKSKSKMKPTATI